VQCQCQIILKSFLAKVKRQNLREVGLNLGPLVSWTPFRGALQVCFTSINYSLAHLFDVGRKLWCKSLRGHYFCATERILIRKVNFTPNSYSSSQNAPFGEGNTFPRLIFLKLKIGQVFKKRIPLNWCISSEYPYIVPSAHAHTLLKSPSLEKKACDPSGLI
jgi:hypothetical protein